MAKKEVYICDVCGAETIPECMCNAFCFEDERFKGYDFNKFTLKIIRERDYNIEKPVMCRKCFLMYLEMAEAQIKEQILLTKGLNNAKKAKRTN